MQNEFGQDWKWVLHNTSQKQYQWSCLVNFLVIQNFIQVVIWVKKNKVKCTLVQALRLCTGRMAHRGSRGIALLFLDHGTRRT